MTETQAVKRGRATDEVFASCTTATHRIHYLRDPETGQPGETLDRGVTVERVRELFQANRRWRMKRFPDGTYYIAVPENLWAYEAYLLR